MTAQVLPVDSQPPPPGIRLDIKSGAEGTGWTHLPPGLPARDVSREAAGQFSFHNPSVFGDIRGIQQTVRASSAPLQAKRHFMVHDGIVETSDIRWEQER